MISDYDAMKIAKYVCKMLAADILPQIAVMQDEVLDINQAAEYLGRSVKTVRNLGDQLPRVKTKGRWFYPKSELKNYLLGGKGGMA